MKRAYLFGILIAIFALGYAEISWGAGNLLYNPSLETVGVSGEPDGWLQGRWGENTAVFSYPVSGVNSGSAARVELTAYVSGDAKWYPREVVVSPGKSYRFSNMYQGTVPSRIAVQFRSGTVYSYQDITSLPSSVSWRAASSTFTVPPGVEAVTIFHLIEQLGSITVDEYLLEEVVAADPRLSRGMVTLSFDDGWESQYVNAAPRLNRAGLKATFYIASSNLGEPDFMVPWQVRSLESKGHEIGAHSKTHPFLTQLTYAQMEDEIIGAIAALNAIGVKSIKTFAYPFGDYNAVTDEIVKRAGYIGARTSDAGLNNRLTDRYTLKMQSVEQGTSAAQIRAWIDEAVTSRTWLILLFHQIDGSGVPYGTTPRNLQRTIDYLKSKRVRVVTTAEGITELQK